MTLDAYEAQQRGALRAQQAALQAQRQYDAAFRLAQEAREAQQAREQAEFERLRKLWRGQLGGKG